MLFRRWISFQLPDQMDTHCLLSSAREHRLKHQDVVGPTWFIFDMSRINYDDIRTVALSLLIITNITLSVLLIVVFTRYPQLREDRTAVCMFSMALSDLANGFTTMPISATLCSRVTPNVRSMTDYLPQIHAAFSAWFNVKLNAQSMLDDGLQDGRHYETAPVRAIAHSMALLCVDMLCVGVAAMGATLVRIPQQRGRNSVEHRCVWILHRRFESHS